MEAKVKEELPEKEFQPTTERRKSITSKERKSPEHEEQRSSPIPAPSSPQNGVPDAVSPPLSEGPRTAPVLHRLRKFLSALLQFAGDVSPDVGDRVKQLIFNLVGGSMTIDEFQVGVQECTNYPLRASVPGFLRALLPHAQRDLMARARGAKQTPLQYIRSHEHLILESGSTDTSDIFAPASQTTEIGVKRRISDPFYDGSFPQTNGSQTGVDPIEYPPHIKRHPSNLFLNPSPFWYPMPSSSNMFDYHSYHGFNNSGDNFERKDGGITVRDVQTMNATFSETRGVPNPGTGNMGLKNEDEWKNINTMLNCILSMVEKTKRALAILQQRGVEPTENNDIKRAANEIMVAAVRQTEERVAEVRRRAEDAVNQVKRQALIDLQRAVGAAETKALELVAAERSKMERMMADKLQERRTTPPPGTGDVTTSPGNNTQQNCCWNCGRKAQETCSGCNAARYCGAFCQHKDWENHHQVCSGRDQKPAAMLTTSPPVTQSSTITKTLARSTTPSSTNDRISTTERLSLSTLNNVERMLSTTQDRAPSTDRVALASLSGAQGLIGAIGGKK